MIKPTVGRVVWYRPFLDPGAVESEPLAAMIAHVGSDRLVNLAVFDAVGASNSRKGVPLLQDGDPRPHGGGFAEWMPYQKGQAAKTEAVEAQLSLQVARMQEPAIGLTFGDAVVALNRGRKVARSRWSPGVFVYLEPAGAYRPSTKIVREGLGETLRAPHGCYFSIMAEDGIIDVWSPSARECIAVDWQIVEG